jgi:hypothetical protein
MEMKRRVVSLNIKSYVEKVHFIVSKCNEKLNWKNLTVSIEDIEVLICGCPVA